MTETQSEVPTNLSIQDNRRNMVSMYTNGASNDAKIVFFATPGATEEGWLNLERILKPVQDFVVMGNLPYVLSTVAAQPEDPGLTPPADPAEWSQPPPAETSSTPTSTGTVPAAELIARAQAATTREELDEILTLANGRVTVIDAVEAQAAELGL